MLDRAQDIFTEKKKKSAFYIFFFRFNTDTPGHLKNNIRKFRASKKQRIKEEEEEEQQQNIHQGSRHLHKAVTMQFRGSCARESSKTTKSREQ